MIFGGHSKGLRMSMTTWDYIATNGPEMVSQENINDMVGEIDELISQLQAKDKLLKEASGALKKKNDVIQYCYDACLCERFETKGFDYHEEHPKFGNKGGSRSKTPKNYIEDVIGYEWKYEKLTGVCDSHKELNLKQTLTKIDEHYAKSTRS